MDAGAPLESVYAAPGADAGLVARAVASGIRVYDLEPGVVERLASTVTPQPVMATCRTIDVSIDTLDEANLVVVCVDVRDPGNLGTVIRSADASGADAVVCGHGCVDAYNPKCVRASAGSLFHVPLVVRGAPEDALVRLAQFGLRRLGSNPHAVTAYDLADMRQPTAIVVGNEARGLPTSLAGFIDDEVVIPLRGGAESLNVGMAAAVLCFEAARQRRPGSGGPG